MTTLLAPPDQQPADDDGTVGDGRRDRTLRRLAVASVVVAITPIVFAAARAIHNGWLPTGDNAYFTIRARDVFTAHPPLLGTWTSASLSLGKDINNPGPMLFDLLALPVRVNGAWGLVIGVALINVMAVVGIALVARRLGGPALVIASMAMAAALAWSMGSEILFEPWQPHSLLLPFLCLLMLVWGLVQGDLVLFPWAVFVASLIVQTHVSYLVLVVGLGAWALGGAIWRSRQMMRADPDGDARAGLLRKWRRVTVISLVVGAICWIQPVIEQFTADGQGNLARLATSAGKAQDPVGARLGVRLVSSVLSVPPFWSRPSFDNRFRPAYGQLILPGMKDVAGLPSVATAVLSLVVLVAALGLCLWWAWRRGDRLSASALATALFVTVVTVVATTAMPVGIFGVLAHQVRWLWPIGVFATFALALSVARGLSKNNLGRGAAAFFGVVLLVFSIWNLPTHRLSGGSGNDPVTIDVVRKLDKAMDAVEGKGTVLFDVSGLQVFQGYTTPLQAELQRRGIPFVVGNDPSIFRQLGDNRRFNGQAGIRLFLKQGPAARAPQPGATRIALVEGLPADQKAELDDAWGAVQTLIRDRGLRLLPEADSVAPGSPEEAAVTAIAAAPHTVPDPDLLFAAIQANLLDQSPDERAAFVRWAALQQQADNLVVAAFLAPVSSAG